MKRKPKRPAPTAETPYEIRVIGAEPSPLRDFYHTLLRLSWTRTLGLVAFAYLVLNALFALGYVEVGGVAHARPNSFDDAFFFSVQTLGTIGYGVMYPETDAANVLVLLESTTGLVFVALLTGLVFAKFSRPTARLMFSKQATLSPLNGVATLAFRVGNRRSNRIVEAEFRVTLIRTEITSEGNTFYRSVELELVRSRAQSLQRSWVVLHTLDAKSPLAQETPESLAAKEAEIHVSVIGIDDTWMQTVHAGHRYFAADLVWGARHADVLSEDGNVLTLDLTRFHQIEPTEPVAGFPYPARIPS